VRKERREERGLEERRRRIYSCSMEEEAFQFDVLFMYKRSLVNSNVCSRGLEEEEEAI
jgi:hypothetical protein